MAGNKDIAQIYLLDIGITLIVKELIVGLIEYETPILKSLYP